MGEWIDLPVLADDGLIHIDLLQDIWEDIYNLKNLRYAEVAFDGGGSYASASGTFADVNVLIRLEFESFGSDFLVGLMVNQSNGNVNAGGKVRFELDGVAYGNADGLMNIQNYSGMQNQQIQLLYLFRNIAAGDHTLDLQFALGPSNGGTTTLYPVSGRYIFWEVEFP